MLLKSMVVLRDSTCSPSSAFSLDSTSMSAPPGRDHQSVISSLSLDLLSWSIVSSLESCHHSYDSRELQDH